jgi:DnaJ-class molecular chaperone
MAGKDESLPGSGKPVSPGDPLDLTTSVAGEEDPGASIDMAQARGTEGRDDQPAGQAAKQPSGGQPAMAPGDEAPAGTPGTGETICPQCGGSGRAGASSCPTCLGTGKVTVGIGGA